MCIVPGYVNINKYQVMCKTGQFYVHRIKAALPGQVRWMQRRDLMLAIYVCVGSACHIKGSYNVVAGLQKVISDRGLGGQVDVKAAFCLGECTNAVSVKVDDGEIYSVNEKSVAEFFDRVVMPRLEA